MTTAEINSLIKLVEYLKAKPADLETNYKNGWTTACDRVLNILYSYKRQR